MITSYQLLISLPSSIITLWKKTEGITMKKKDTLSCLSNSLLPWFLLPLQVYSDFLFSKEKIMADIVAILSLICSKEMLMLVPIMIITGYLLKHYTKFPNGYIPVIEMSMGFVLGIIYAVAFNPEGNIVASISMYGGQGLVLGFVSISIYDAVHGAVCHHIGKEVQMEETEKKVKANPFEHPVFVYFLAFLAATLYNFLVYLIFYGVHDSLIYLRDGAVTIIPTMVLIDVICKLATGNRKSINWQYLVMVGLVVASTLFYTGASVTTTKFAMYACLALCATSAAGSALVCNKLVCPTRSGAVDSVKEKAVSDLVELGVPRESAEMSAEYFLN